MVDDRREGRGRLSSIDLLPDEAEPDIVWALEALRERKQPQATIFADFNARLADRGIGGVSRSAFSRWSIRKAIQFRRLDEVRAITGDIVGGLGTDGADEVTMAVAEMLKVAIYELLEDRRDPKQVMELARALSSAVSAQKASAENRRKLQEEIEQRLAKAAEAVNDVGTQAGVGADTLRKITSLLTTGAA